MMAYNNEKISLEKNCRCVSNPSITCPTAVPLHHRHNPLATSSRLILAQHVCLIDNRNHDNVSVFFPAIELKIAMKTWDILKATYLIASLHISNEHTAYLFEISRYINI